MLLVHGHWVVNGAFRRFSMNGRMVRGASPYKETPLSILWPRARSHVQ